MGFWGVLLKPNEPYTLPRDSDDDDGGDPPKRLRISQATLADRSGLWTSRSVVRCAVGNKPPVFICSLSIREVSSCQLDLEFEEKEDVVFSVKGPRGVHLAGYFLNSNGTTSTATLTTHAPKFNLEGKEKIVKMNSDYNRQDTNITHTDGSELQISPANNDLEDKALQPEYIANEMNGGSLPGRVVVGDANEEQINEKTKQSSDDVDKIHAAEFIAGVSEVNKRVVHKCDSRVLKEVDVGLGDAGKLTNSNCPEKLLLVPGDAFKENQHQSMVSNATELLQENGYVSPSWNTDECDYGLRHCGKVKKKKGKETIMECKSVEDDARNAARQSSRNKNFEIRTTNSLLSQDKSSSISPRKKLKKAEVEGDGFEKAGLDLPDDALESHTKLQKGTLNSNAGNGYTRSHSQSKKVKKKKNKDMEDDDTHVDKYIIREKEPFQQEQDQSIVKEGEKESAKEKAVIGSSEKEEKSHKRPKDGKRRSGQHDGSPKGGDLGSEFTLNYKEDRGGPKDVNHNDTFCEGVEEKNKSLANHGNQRRNKILDDKTEQASGLSVSHRKKKKKVRIEEGTVGEKDPDGQDHALVSQSKLPNAMLRGDNGYALERSYSTATKENKKKKQHLDDDKHLGKKMKIERNEVAIEEVTEGSAKEKGKSYKNSDVKNIKRDVHDGNAKGLISAENDFEFAMEVEVKDSDYVEGRDLGGVYAVESVEIGATNVADDNRKQRQNDKLSDVAAEKASGLSVSHRKKKKKVRMREGMVGEKHLNPLDHDALVSQPKLPNESLDDDNGYALERSHSNATIEQKKKKQHLDDDKHLAKKKKIERNEVGTGEATDGGAKEKGNSYKKSDVNNIKGDVQEGNAKSLISADNDFEFAMEVEAKDSDNVEQITDKKAKLKRRKEAERMKQQEQLSSKMTLTNEEDGSKNPNREVEKGVCTERSEAIPEIPQPC